MKSDDTFENKQCAIAYEDYLEEKADAQRLGNPHSITIAIIERRNGLQKNKLRYYMANHVSRKKTVRD